MKKLFLLTLAGLTISMHSSAQTMPNGAAGAIETDNSPESLDLKLSKIPLGKILRWMKERSTKLSVGLSALNPGEERRYGLQLSAEGAIFQEYDWVDDEKVSEFDRSTGLHNLAFTVKSLGNGAYTYSVSAIAFKNANAYYRKAGNKYFKNNDIPAFAVINEIRGMTLKVDNAYTLAGVNQTDLEVIGVDLRLGLIGGTGEKVKWWVAGTAGSGFGFNLAGSSITSDIGSHEIWHRSPQVSSSSYVGLRSEAFSRNARFAVEQRFNHFYRDRDVNFLVDGSARQNFRGSFFQTLIDLSVKTSSNGKGIGRIGIEGSLNWSPNIFATRFNQGVPDSEGRPTFSLDDLDIGNRLNVGTITFYVQY